VGGVYADPLLPGSEGGALFRAVPEAAQREVVETIGRLAFAPGAYEAEGSVLRYVEPANLSQDTRYVADLGQVAAERQGLVLGHPLSEEVLSRMDGGFYGGTYRATDLLLDLNRVVIGEDLTGTPDPLRRAGQIAYVERLVGLLQRGEGAVRTAALAALQDVRRRMGLTDILMRADAKAHRAVIGRLLDEAGV
jgi:hypothetical protein